jgi:hypothetical protein
MTELSRRDFFLRTFKRPENPEIIIGKIFDFPLGEKKILCQAKMIIESLPEGLRAQSTEEENKFYPIKTNHVGELVVNRAETWTKAQVFSVLTNETIYLDTSLEDRI